MEANHTVTAQQTTENVDCRVSEYKTATFENLLHDLLRGKPFSEKPLSSTDTERKKCFFLAFSTGLLI